MKYAAFAAISGLFLTGCTEEVDNSYSRFPSVMDITASAGEIVLNEDTPDEVALTVSWTSVNPGEGYIVEYEYAYTLSENSNVEESEKVFEGEEFVREYTHKDLQDILMNTFGYKTSTWGNMIFTIEAVFTGDESYGIIPPDEASVNVRVKTYGDKQFAADRIFMGGAAVGAENIELTPSETNPSLYVYNGNLSAGDFNFPVVYGDENNVIIPSGTADVTVESGNTYDAVVVGSDETLYSWKITDAESYRVTLNMETEQVTVIKTADIMEVDKIFMSGTAIGTEAEVTQTLENASVYAWRGELSAGTISFPIEFGGERNLTIVPNSNDHTFNDGQGNAFMTVNSSAADTRYWQITSAGTYRIVIDTDARTVTIYSPETDLQPRYTVGSWNGDAAGYGNPVENVEIECLWMYGTFSSRVSGDSGLQVGFQRVYRCMRSLADPQVFVYSGEELPRNAGSDFFEDPAPAGAVMFFIGPEEPYTSETTNKLVQPWNNTYAFGSTADAKRNDHCGYVDAVLNVPAELVEGQSDNRYAYFNIPEGCNHVVVDTRNMTVTFRQVSAQ